MDAENAGREDLSPYEAAKAYKYWLDSGIFKNQNELAEKLGITRSWVNKVLSLTKIPSEIVSAIGGPKNLSIKEGLELIKIIAYYTSRKIHYFCPPVDPFYEESLVPSPPTSPSSLIDL
jgi:ParB/RepB/Spo0J family partition protein